MKDLNKAEEDEFLEQPRALEFEDDWDRQMDADASAGKIDFLVREADDATRGGSLRDWPNRPRP